MDQLPLPLQLRQDVDFAAFVAGRNAEAVAAVAAWARGSGADFLYLFGGHGNGKTHLLQAACREAAQGDRRVIYLPLKHEGLAPPVLDNLELWEQVALDDVQAVAGQSAWEHGLFDLYNRLREAGRRLLVSADSPVAELPLMLADLRSRLGWGPGYQLLPLSEQDCEQLLRESGKRLGLTLEGDTVEYILRRCPREPGFLLGLLEEIDRESLCKQRRPTLWLIRQILGAHESQFRVSPRIAG